MPQAYEFLAKWFECLNDDCDYPAWSQYFLSGLARLGAGRRGLEVGCGSGHSLVWQAQMHPLSFVFKARKL